MSTRLKWLLAIILEICTVVGLLVYIYKATDLELVYKPVELLPIECNKIHCTQIEDNKLECDLATVSLIVKRMTGDGFQITEDRSTEKEIDIFLERDEDSIRLHYDSNRILTSISKSFERSYLPITYINEKIMEK